MIYGCELHSDTGYPFYVLVKNKKGLKELYEFVSKAYDNEIPTDSIDEVKRENLILGTSIDTKNH